MRTYTHTDTAEAWRDEIDPRLFIQENYEPYEEDASFLAPSTNDTKALSDTVHALLTEHDAVARSMSTRRGSLL